MNCYVVKRVMYFYAKTVHGREIQSIKRTCFITYHIGLIVV